MRGRLLAHPDVLPDHAADGQARPDQRRHLQLPRASGTSTCCRSCSTRTRTKRVLTQGLAAARHQPGLQAATTRGLFAGLVMAMLPVLVGVHRLPAPGAVRPDGGALKYRRRGWRRVRRPVRGVGGGGTGGRPADGDRAAAGAAAVPGAAQRVRRRQRAGAGRGVRHPQDSSVERAVALHRCDAETALAELVARRPRPAVDQCRGRRRDRRRDGRRARLLRPLSTADDDMLYHAPTGDGAVQRGRADAAVRPRRGPVQHPRGRRVLGLRRPAPGWRRGPRSCGRCA